MKPLTCTRRIQFCAGHRVMGHENKCANMHGHNYVAFITAQSQSVWNPLDNVGRVVDFSVLKEGVGGWIDENWDHGFIHHVDDQAAIHALRIFDERIRASHEDSFEQKVYPMKENPTAENMAKYLLEHVCPLVLKDYGVYVTQVKLWETENCYAVAEHQTNDPTLQ